MSVVDADMQHAAQFLLTLAHRTQPVSWAACWLRAPFLLNTASTTYRVIMPCAARLYAHTLAWGAFSPILAAALELRYMTMPHERAGWVARHRQTGARVLRALVATYFARIDAIDIDPVRTPVPPVTCRVPLCALGLDDTTMRDPMNDDGISVTDIGRVLRGHHEDCDPDRCNTMPCTIIHARAWAVALHVAMFDWPPDVRALIHNKDLQYRVFHQPDIPY